MSKPGEVASLPSGLDSALDWLLQIDRGDIDAVRDPQFRAWLERDPANAAAYARASAIWREPAFIAALEDDRRRPSHRSAQWIMRIAASIALVALLGSATLRLTGGSVRWPADYAAPVGGQLATRLGEGTRVVLDSGSAIDVAYDDRSRTIALRDGRIFVDVGRDRRPFRILAGAVEVRDVGTRFSAEREGDTVRIAVQQGEVALRAGEHAATGQRLTAGQTGGYAHGFLPVRTVPGDISFAWLDHRLFFSQQTLGDVVQQLQRYHRGWIIVATPRLAKVRISGGYDTRDPASAMEDLARLSGGSLIRLSDRLLILR